MDIKLETQRLILTGKKNGNFMFELRKKSDINNIIGYIILFSNGEITVFLNEDARNMGFGREGFHAVVGYAKKQNMDLSVKIVGQNEASKKMVESEGFIKENQNKDNDIDEYYL